jgi:transposase-like protein
MDHGAQDRCRAVLSVWTERRRPSDVCREMNIRTQTLDNWQNRALEGMLQALEPRLNLKKGSALPGRLQRFLDKRVSAKKSSGNPQGRLSERLLKIQGAKA